MPFTAPDRAARDRSHARGTDARSFHAICEGCTLIEIRKPAESDQGYCPAAVDIARGMRPFQALAHSNVAHVSGRPPSRKERPLVLAGHDGDRAAVAALDWMCTHSGDGGALVGAMERWTNGAPRSSMYR